MEVDAAVAVLVEVESGVEVVVAAEVEELVEVKVATEAEEEEAMEEVDGGAAEVVVLFKPVVDSRVEEPVADV